MAKAQSKVEQKVETAPFDKTIKFTGKKLGANFIANYGSERYARKVSMEEGTAIFAAIEKFNKRPSEGAKKKLIEMLTPESTKTAKEVERKEMQAKGLEKKAKKEEKAVKVEKAEQKDFLTMLDEFLTETPEAVTKLEAVLSKHKKVEERKPMPVASSYRRTGEY